MWLTGFDAPSLHTMYVDKPMRGHTLMQAIARVNRVFKDKKGGLIVDYIGLANDLRKALAEYTENDKNLTGIPQDVAVQRMKAHYEVVVDLFHGFDYKRFFTAEFKGKIAVLIDAMDHILKLEKGKDRYLKEVSNLLFAFAVQFQTSKL